MTVCKMIKPMVVTEVGHPEQPAGDHPPLPTDLRSVPKAVGAKFSHRAANLICCDPWNTQNHEHTHRYQLNYVRFFSQAGPFASCQSTPTAMPKPRRRGRTPQALAGKRLWNHLRDAEIAGVSVDVRHARQWHRQEAGCKGPGGCKGQHGPAGDAAMFGSKSVARLVYDTELIGVRFFKTFVRMRFCFPCYVISKSIDLADLCSSAASSGSQKRHL